LTLLICLSAAEAATNIEDSAAARCQLPAVSTQLSVQRSVRNNGGSDSGQDIWLYQFGRGTLSRFTSKANDAETPIWTPDGKRVAYAVVALRRVTFDDGRRVVRRVPGTANGS